jgi:hypothetical protein
MEAVTAKIAAKVAPTLNATNKDGGGGYCDGVLNRLWSKNCQMPPHAHTNKILIIKPSVVASVLPLLSALAFR